VAGEGKLGSDRSPTPPGIFARTRGQEEGLARRKGWEKGGGRVPRGRERLVLRGGRKGGFTVPEFSGLELLERTL